MISAHSLAKCDLINAICTGVQSSIHNEDRHHLARIFGRITPTLTRNEGEDLWPSDA